MGGLGSVQPDGRGVVVGLELRWWDVADRAVQAVGVVPADPLDHANSTSSRRRQQRRSISSALKVPISDSAMALSYESATEPIEGVTPTSARRPV